jgi:hypothetical protein
MNLTHKDDWHVHLTVEPRSAAMAQTYKKACAVAQCKPTIIDNLDGSKLEPSRKWQELIPSVKFTGELGQAMIMASRIETYFMMSGFTVVRVKIEGRVRTADSIYGEAHVHLAAAPHRPHAMALSRSLTSGKLWGTSRFGTADDVQRHVVGGATEWIAYDSNREKDAAWLRSWGLGHVG